MATAPSDPLDQASRAWVQRLSQIQAAGIDPKPAAAVARYDMQRVAQGGTPRSDLEVLNEVRQAYTGQSVINKAPGHGILDIPGNVGRDLESMVQGFLPGLAHTAVAAVSPKEWGNLGQAVADLSPREISQTKLGALIPGMWTLGSSTSEKMQHPLMSVIDILPYASEAAKLATPALADAAKIAESPALTALSEGHPLKAAVNARFFPGNDFAAATSISDRVKSAFRDTAGATENKPVYIFYNSQKRQVQRDATHVLTKMADEGVIDPALSMEDRAKLAEQAVRYKPGDPNVPPEQVAYFDKIKKWIDDNVVDSSLGQERSRLLHGRKGDKVETGTGLVRVPTQVNGPDGNLVWEVYPAKHPVVKAYNKYMTAQDAEIAANNLVDNRTAILDEARKRFAAAGGKIRGFNETVDAFRARPVGIVSTKAAYDAAAPLLKENLGPHFERMMQALQDARPQAAQRALKQVLADETLPDPIRSYLSGYFQDALKGMKGKMAKGNAAALAVQRANASVNEAMDRLSSAQDATVTHRVNYYKKLGTNPSERWHPLLKDAILAKTHDALDAQAKVAESQAHQMMSGEALVDAVSQIHQHLDAFKSQLEAMTNDSQVANLVGEATFNTVKNEVINNWQDLIRQGYDPVWLQNVHPVDYERAQNTYITPLPEHYDKPEHLRIKTFDMSPGVMDVTAAMTKFAVDQIRDQATHDLVNWMIDNGHVVSYDNLRQQLTDAFNGVPRPGATVASMVEREINQHYRAFDPTAFGPTYKIKGGNTRYMIPKGLDKGFRSLLDTDGKLPTTGIYNKIMNVFKLAVLTGPRHLVHVGLGGLTMQMLREPGAVTDLARAYDLVKNHPEQLHELYQQRLLQGVYHEQPDTLLQYATGHTMGRLVREHWLMNGLENVVAKFSRFEQTISDMYRVATALHAEAKGAEVDSAVALANKVFVDLDNMTPFERSTIRQVLPFWAFTKHTLRYVFTYPADHPWRAAILANMARQLEEDNASGYPERLSQLFFWGKPDAKGNIPAVDMRNLNPFRSMASAFSMEGFFQGLNPILQQAAGAVGINPRSASPELYPTLTIDQFTGAQQSKRPGVDILGAAEAIIPEIGTLDHFINASDRIRNMKRYSPEAYRRDLFSSLNLPFSVANVNLPQTAARYAQNTFEVAQNAVSNAMRTGDTQELRKYDMVPFRGQMLPASTLADFIDRLQGRLPSNIAPAAIMPRTSATRTKKARIRRR